MTIEEFISACMTTNGKCLQGCGTMIHDDAFFCSAACRARYNLHTWGEGRPAEDLTEVLNESLRREHATRS